MLAGNHAVRLGLRASSRNPELAFAKALLDQLGSLLTLLPLLLAGALFAAAAGDRGALQGLLRGFAVLRALRWPVAGGLLAALSISWALGIGFWSGALPLLAADAEMNARPPPGHFLLLAGRGYARVAGAGAVGSLLSLLYGAVCIVALVAALPLLALRPSPALLASAALVIALAVVGGFLVDLLARLMLVRAAALGDGVTAAFGAAASLLGARLGACLAIAAAFLLLELVVAALGTLVSGVLSGGALLSANAELLSLAPRVAVGLAFAAVFSWLEVGRQGALAALAADAEGLIDLPPEPPPRAAVPAVLERPREERVIEALPVDEVIEALPVDAEPGEAARGEAARGEAAPRRAQSAAEKAAPPAGRAAEGAPGTAPGEVALPAAPAAEGAPGTAPGEERPDDVAAGRGKPEQ